MKKLLLLFSMIVVLVSTTISQTGNSFKHYTKNPSGTSTKSLTYRNISGKSNLKSASTGSTKPGYVVSSKMQLPSLNNDSVQNEIPIFFEKRKAIAKSANRMTYEEQFYAFHNLSRQNTLLHDPVKELRITAITTDELGITHIKAQQLFKGIEVYGAESFVHLGEKKDIFNGYILKIDQELDTTPKVSESKALDIIYADLQNKTVVKELSTSEKQILKYDSPIVNRVIYENKLAWEISIRPNFIQEWRYFIDAHSGEILFAFNNTNSDGPATAMAYDLNNVQRTVDTYLQNGTYYLVNATESMYDAATEEGVIMTLDANNTSTIDLDYTDITSPNNTWNNKAAISAHYSATKTYEYFENTFERVSLNGQGGNIISFINVTNDDGTSMENAFWNGQAAFYGNGGDVFKPLAGSLDVIAHELGHGVVSTTANLEYYGQSGALNESFADIFGAMVDRDDWLIGEDIVYEAYFPSGAMRNMADPHNTGTSEDHFWQPMHMSEIYIGSGDNAGVHINCGITNYAYYLYATSVSKEKSEQVFYRALTSYLTSRSKFIDLRIAVIQSAKDLYGENSQEVIQAGFAFDSVGIYEGESVDYAQDYEVNTGDDFLLTYNTFVGDPTTLYRTNTFGFDFYPLSYTEMKGSVSVSDDGSAAVFVANDDRIKVLSTDVNNIQEEYLSDEASFDNVAFSKDGNRIAAISKDQDTAIYVYDFNLEEWARFQLYNPTTSHDGTSAGGVLYADAIEFDHTGEYLIYDSYNELNSSTGEDIGYWDIGFIKVWDNATSNFGDGTISKLYGSLPEKVSIGNPTFSKNSPYIIAFDYIDELTWDFGVFGANTLTGDVDLIFLNSTLGFPSYSVADDRIAFTALSMDNTEVVGAIDLAENKISGIGDAFIVVEYAKWPTYYATGSRSLELKPVADFTVDVKSGEAPLSVKFIDLSINNPDSWNWAFEGGTPMYSSDQNPVVLYKKPGTYQVKLTCTNSAGESTVIKTNYITVTGGLNPSDIPAISDLISYYPNPSKGTIIIDTQKEFEIQIFSTSGRLLFESKNDKSIDISSLNKGVYILKLQLDNNVLVDRLILE